MKFNFNDIKNKETLLARYSEEEIMEMMGVPIEERRFCSPFRNDRTPTCSLWRAPGNEVLYYMDWAVFNEPVDCFGLYMYLYNCTFNEAIVGIWGAFDREFSSKPSTKSNHVIDARTITETKIVATSRSWTPKDLRWWNNFGVTRVELDKYLVRPAEIVWLGDRIIYQHSSSQIPSAYFYTFPEGIKVYFPSRDYNRFYHNNGKLVQGWEQLPDHGEIVVVTKSLKDVMLFSRFNLPAVAPQSESILLSNDTLVELHSRFDKVVIVYDQDRAGIIALLKYRKLGLTVFMLPKKWGAKDMTDFYAKYGLDKTSELIASTKEYLQNGGTQSFNYTIQNE